MAHIFEFLVPFLVVGIAAVAATLVLASFWRRSTELRAIEETIRSVVDIHKGPRGGERRADHDEGLSKAEIRAVLEMIRSHSSGALQRRLEPLTSLIDESKQVQTAETSEAVRSADPIAVLESIERMIAGERRSALVESSFVSRIFAQRTLPAPSAPRASPIDAETASKSPAGKQGKEPSAASAVLLAEVTEKFYGSWAFRIVGFALLAAVVLAVTGNLIIGSTSVGLVEQMDKAAKDAIQEISTQKKDVGGELDRQLEQLSEQIADGKAEVVTAVDAFRDQSANSIKDIAKKVLDDIGGSTSQLLRDLEGKVGLVRDNVDSLEEKGLIPAEQKMDELTERISAATEDMGGLSALTERVRWAEDHLRSLNNGQESLSAAIMKASSALLDAEKLGSAQQKIDGLAKKIDAATQDMGGLSDLTERVRWAEDTVRSLNNGRNSLRAAIADASSVIETLRSEKEAIAKPKTEIDAFDVKLRALEERTAAIEKSVQSGLTPPSEGDKGAIAKPKTEVDAFGSALRTLEERVAAIEKLLPASVTSVLSSSIPLAEGDLDPRMWQDIQRALAQKQLYPAEIDGKPGSKTRKAIADYQKERGVAANGHLTPIQIADLAAAPR